MERAKFLFHQKIGLGQRSVTLTDKLMNKIDRMSARLNRTDCRLELLQGLWGTKVLMRQIYRKLV